MTKTDDLSFEEAMSQLESTVSAMENGDLGLDQLLAKFEAGIGLLRRCEEKLGEAQAKIEVLSKAAISAVDEEPKNQAETDDKKAKSETGAVKTKSKAAKTKTDTVEVEEFQSSRTIDDTEAPPPSSEPDFEDSLF